MEIFVASLRATVRSRYDQFRLNIFIFWYQLQPYAKPTAFTLYINPHSIAFSFNVDVPLGVRFSLLCGV